MNENHKEEFKPKDVRLFSILNSLYNNKNTDNDNYDPISVYKVIEMRDQALLESIKKDMLEIKEKIQKYPMIFSPEIEAKKYNEGYLKSLDDTIYFLKNYNQVKNNNFTLKNESNII